MSEMPDRIVDWVQRAVHWLPYHEPTHPDYEGARSDIGREGREIIADIRARAEEGSGT